MKRGSHNSPEPRLTGLLCLDEHLARGDELWHDDQFMFGNRYKVSTEILRLRIRIGRTFFAHKQQFKCMSQINNALTSDLISVRICVHKMAKTQ